MWLLTWHHCMTVVWNLSYVEQTIVTSTVLLPLCYFPYRAIISWLHYTFTFLLHSWLKLEGKCGIYMLSDLAGKRNVEGKASSTTAFFLTDSIYVCQIQTQKKTVWYKDGKRNRWRGSLVLWWHKRPSYHYKLQYSNNFTTVPLGSLTSPCDFIYMGHPLLPVPHPLHCTTNRLTANKPYHRSCMLCVLMLTFSGPCY